MFEKNIRVRGARVHNLKNIDVDIPIDKFTVITGLSGSGKSSLAFDTIYAEGQRRYVESLSSYARQFLGIMGKPDVDSIKGLSPAISIEQRSISHNPRSTVGTITEIYDYLRLLFARIGQAHCPLCGMEIKSQDAEAINKSLYKEFIGQEIKILAPIIRGKKGSHEQIFSSLNKLGYVKVNVDGLEEAISEYLGDKKKVLQRYAQHDIAAVIDTIILETVNKSRLQQSLENALNLGEGLIKVLILGRPSRHNVGSKPITEKMYSKHLACPDCGLSFDNLQPRLFSFNSPFGACPTCHGLGFIQKFEADLIMPDKDLSLRAGAIKPAGFSTSGFFMKMLTRLASHFSFDLDTPIGELDKKAMEVILFGSEEKIDWRFDSSSSEMYWEWTGKWEGLIPRLERLYKQTSSDSRRFELEKYMINKPCGACDGSRLKQESLAVRINEKNIFELNSLSIRDLFDFISHLHLSVNATKIAEPIIKETKDRLQFLMNVGLDYLTLSRNGGTLSGGEAQRIRLATQIGSELRGVMYILDEPSIGLHQRDNQKLIKTLQEMRDLGNTVIVVEHDEETMLAADHLIDIGPGAGVHGGQVMAIGTPEEVKKNTKSLTGDYLAHRQTISVPKTRRKPSGWINLLAAAENNLKKINVKFPTEVLCVVTGVSGSGKSTLVSQTLYPILANKLYQTKIKPGQYDKIENYGHVDKVIIIDQTPIGRTPRSNPATYTGVFTPIRELFASLKESKIKGYKSGRFSFNVDGGRCGTCAGDGVIKIEMNFLPDVYVECENCRGQRYNEETLLIRYKDKNIADILAMTIEEALKFFQSIPLIRNKLQIMFDVGLGYIKLGQSATTLSGGEAQRLKLSVELAKRDTGRTLYILDEPTTGLHFADIKKMLVVLNKLVDKGNTILVIEHNLDVIKSADWIIDLGPEGGAAGGEVIAVGTPEEIAKKKESYTGQFLKKILKI